ncbi:MAG: hypothetical protein U9O94_00260 [Nanoarchaeota archaeon]|nr:hypothetical protein [Nanoarchaeota archaeon]
MSRPDSAPTGRRKFLIEAVTAAWGLSVLVPHSLQAGETNQSNLEIISLTLTQGERTGKDDLTAQIEKTCLCLKYGNDSILLGERKGDVLNPDKTGVSRFDGVLDNNPNYFRFIRGEGSQTPPLYPLLLDGPEVNANYGSLHRRLVSGILSYFTSKLEKELNTALASVDPNEILCSDKTAYRISTEERDGREWKVLRIYSYSAKTEPDNADFVKIEYENRDNLPGPYREFVSSIKKTMEKVQENCKTEQEPLKHPTHWELSTTLGKTPVRFPGQR